MELQQICCLWNTKWPPDYSWQTGCWRWSTNYVWLVEVMNTGFFILGAKFIGHFYVMSDTYPIYLCYVGRILHRKHLCYTGHTWYRMFIILGTQIRHIFVVSNTRIEYIYITMTHYIGLSMLYQTYSCCIGRICVYRTHVKGIFILYRTYGIGYIFVISDIFMLCRTYFLFYGTHYIGHIYVLSDTFILYRTYITSDIFMFYLTHYIRHILAISGTRFIGRERMYWTHI